MEKTEMKKMDWHLIWTAGATIFVICSVVIGCYINLRSELTTIKTVLILKGIMPESMAKNEAKNE